MDELQGHLTAAGVTNAQETAEALSEQDIEWTLLVDIFARPDSDGGRTGVSAQFTRFMVFLAAKIGFFANFFVGDKKSKHQL